MAVALADLVTQLQASAPAIDGVPADYEQIVQDAVAQLSQDAPVRRRAALAIVSGTATYDLPDDFLFLIGFERTTSGDVLITDSGLVPVLQQPIWEAHHIEAGQITFVPAPGYTANLYYRYGAAYTLDESDRYAMLTTNGARVALLYAQYLALSAQAEQAGGGWKYQIGDEMVDKSGAGNEPAARANDALVRYRQALASGKQALGMRSRTPSWTVDL